jgi:hypothetical protein
MSFQSSSSTLNSGMGDMGTTDGQPDMQMYGSTVPPTAAQVLPAAGRSAALFAQVNRSADLRAAPLGRR